ncbi:MAG: 3-oxoacyl-[acyl-carrier protein] reductase, partial [uncultured Thermoleophilia bacterium]
AWRRRGVRPLRRLGPRRRRARDRHGGRALRPARHRLRQRGRQRRLGPHRGPDPGRVGRHARHQPQGHVPDRPRGDPPPPRRGRRQHHRDRERQRHADVLDPGRLGLQRLEGRAGGLRADGRARAGPPRDPGQLGAPGPHPHEHRRAHGEAEHRRDRDRDGAPGGHPGHRRRRRGARGGGRHVPVPGLGSRPPRLGRRDLRRRRGVAAPL